MIYILVFFSGFAALVYQVLWMKQLGFLFGNGSYASAATLAAFFAGLAAGGWFWGRMAARLRNPLRVYGRLQVGVACTSLLYFVILYLFYKIYPYIYQHVHAATLMLVVKFVLALILVFPPAFCMGGTVPMMGQHQVRALSRFGFVSALLYAINTLGAALGAYLAGFHLPLWLGFRASYMVALLVTVAVALLSFWLARREPAAPAVLVPDEPREDAGAGGVGRGRGPLLALCFLSGFGVLALEVLWNRMFAQVLENSVYTFSAILVVVLLSLALGAFLSALLARRVHHARSILLLLLFGGGVVITVTPFVFMYATNTLEIVVSTGTWVQYVGLIFRKVVLTIGVPAVVLGTLFPFLMKAEERYARSAGRSIGVLVSVNTVGAVLGALACGFLFLGQWGMWRTMQVLACLYLVAALLYPAGRGKGILAFRAASAVMLVLLFTVLDPSGLPVNSIDRMRPDEVILRTWEGSGSTVSVADSRRGRAIKINSHYGLGSTGALQQQRIQADLPLTLYPEVERIFFLGAGTGITAGSALDPSFSNVTRVVACELVPEVVEAARLYIADVDGKDYTGGLFSDPRAKVIVEDGRHFLMAAEETFDMINSDLFVPFRSGAGSLYSREHFAHAKERLRPGGLFVQWLPLYQLTENEVMIIARTMLDVFELVTLWRGNFQPGEEVVALIGHTTKTPLPPAGLDSRADKRQAVVGKGPADLLRLSLPFNRQTVLLFYGGNLTAAQRLFAAYPLNTDDKPLIEYMAPRTYRNRQDASMPWFVGPRIAKLIDEIQRICPPAQDPFLVQRSREDQHLPLAGSAYHWARIWDVIGDPAATRRAWNRFVSEWLPPPVKE